MPTNATFDNPDFASSSEMTRSWTQSWSPVGTDWSAGKGLCGNATDNTSDNGTAPSSCRPPSLAGNPGLPEEHQYVLIALYTATTALAVTGNLVVIVVLTVGRRSRTDLRAFLLNLAVADLTMAAFCMPFTFTTTMLHVWLFGPVMCTIVLFVQVMSVTASVATSTVIAIDRYLVVTRPLRPRASRRLRLVGVWTVSALLASVQLAVGRMSTVEVSPGVWLAICAEAWPEPGSDTWRTAYTFFVLLTTYLLPLGVIAPAYGMVARRLWRRRAPGNADSVRDFNQLQSKRRVIKMLIVVVTLFAVCWLPLHAFIVVLDFVPQLRSEDQPEASGIVIAIYTTVHWLAMSNSFVNPIVYGFLNDSFRYDLRSLVRSCWRCVRRRCSNRDEFSFGDDFLDDASCDSGIYHHQQQHHPDLGIPHRDPGDGGSFNRTPTPSTRPLSHSMRPARQPGYSNSKVPSSRLTASVRSSRHQSPGPDANGGSNSSSRRRRQLLQPSDHVQLVRPTSLSLSGVSSSSVSPVRRGRNSREPSRCGSEVALDSLGGFGFGCCDDAGEGGEGLSSCATSSCCSRPTSYTDATPSMLHLSSPDSGGSRPGRYGDGERREDAEQREDEVRNDGQSLAISTGGLSTVIVPIVSVIDDCGIVSENLC